MAREKFKLRLNMSDREQRQKAYAALAPLQEHWEFTGKPVRPQRSLNANAYYHVAVVEAFREHMSTEQRQHFTHDQCHEYLRDRFVRRDVICDPDGVPLGEMPASSAALDGPEFFEFVEKCREWLWDTFKVDVPDPVHFGVGVPAGRQSA